MITKNFRNKKGQSFIILLIVLLSTMLINGALSIIMSIKTPIDELVKECRIPEAVVNTNDLPEEVLDTMSADFEKIRDVEAVYRIRRYDFKEDKFLRERKLDALMLLTEYNEKAYGSNRCIDGNVDVSSYSDNQCAIAGCVANDQNIKVGDVISVRFASGTKDFEVAGIYANPDNLSIAFSTDVYVKKLPEELSAGTLIAIDVKDGADPLEVENEYRRAHNGKMQGQINTLDSIVDDQLMMVNILGGVLLGMGVGSLAICILIIVFIVRNVIAADTKKIAIYKTCGFKYGDILQMYMVYYTTIVLIGSILGTMASLILSRAILNGVFKDMGASVSVNPFYPGIISVIGVTLCVALCMLLIIRKIKNIKPVFALRGAVGATGRKRRNSGGMGAGFSPFGIAVRSVLRDKKGAVGTVIASIAVVFLTNMGMVAFEGAMKMESENDYWLGIPSCEVVFEMNNKEKLNDVLDKLNSDAEVEKSSPWILEKNVMLPWHEGAKDTSFFLSVYEDFDKVDLRLLEGRNPKSKNEIALASKMAKKLDVKPGDYVTVSLDGLNDVSLLVTGIYQTYYDLGDHGRVVADAYTGRDIAMKYDKIAVFLKKGTDIEQFMDRYSELLGDDVSVTKREDCCKSIMTMISDPQKKAIPPVVGLIIIIGGISIFSIVLLRNIKNQKTNQIYKSIGYTTRDLYLANIWYVIIIGLAAMIIGVPLLLLTFEKIMVLALQVFGLQEYKMHINVLALILTNVLTLICFAVSSIVSSRSLKKLNVRDLVIE